MDSLPTVLLKPGEADRVVAGHPWIYHTGILRLTAPVDDGGLVQVKDHRQRFLGVGFFNSKSKIHVRVLSPERVEVNEKFFEERIRSALAVRQKHLPDATSFRVVNAESDFLSGLIVDKYEDVLVVQISSLGMDQRKAQIATALQQIFSGSKLERPLSGPSDTLSPAPSGGEGRGEEALGGFRPLRAILERSDVASRKFEGLGEANGVLFGEFGARTAMSAGSPTEKDADKAVRAPSITVNLNGLKFETDLVAGHKTGLYLDQQVNYQAVSQFARGAQVLDCFSFLGGFGLHAARAGAAHVHLLDQSADAIAAATRNAAANGLAEKCSFEVVNVFDWLKANTAVKPHERVIPRFDLIILDPPSFTRNRASVPDALRGYKEIHLRALKLLKPGGTLATFCCSHHVDTVTFLDVILSAAYDTRHVLRRVAMYSQSPDHPVIPMIPETEYLKGFAFEIVR
ncbi:MAG: class I SAM-dependent rRNA methyltransferase [Verrucomicrobiota bacterium]|jgi:23S rRNA (cytosine1962-C5)-methyltransferase